MFEGMLLIDKPANMTSFGVVARVRRRLSERVGKRVKVGHTGTLDPFATGLMIVMVGKATKRAEEFSKLDKVYEATFTLGKTSSTGDPEGDITEASDHVPSQDEVEKALRQFVGVIQQTPPVFSAIKIDGQRAYKLARRGESIAMPTREITIYSLELIGYNYPELKIRTHVSSGTYIRTLGEDIGVVLTSGAYCSQLRRTAVGKYTLQQAIPLTDTLETSDLIERLQSI